MIEDYAYPCVLEPLEVGLPVVDMEHLTEKVAIAEILCKIQGVWYMRCTSRIIALPKQVP